jgi:hypothetical protein
MPIVETEDDGIGRRLAPAMLPADFGGADHVQYSIFPSPGSYPLISGPRPFQA